MTVTALKPVLPLAIYYNEKNQLVWPGNSPKAGELKEKRTIFERASEVVLAETKENGIASMATVMDARQKLLDYGRPGLQYVRATRPLASPTPTARSCSRCTNRWAKRSTRPFTTASTVPHPGQHRARSELVRTYLARAFRVVQGGFSRVAR